ncbi:hypothetical protein Z949_2355 [Sulfitobacter guttiformis KCTC 32187]|nr:hypothetical protein Z949_2355 [Sulfitobacter guttiformis KCTC 32187]
MFTPTIRFDVRHAPHATMYRRHKKTLPKLTLDRVFSEQ